MLFDSYCLLSVVHRQPTYSYDNRDPPSTEIETSGIVADAKDVLEAVQDLDGARFSVITPNMKGFQAAVAAGAKEVDVFAAASESFSKSNINCSIENSLARYREVANAAKELEISVRGLYFTKVKIGSPPKFYNVQIDTRSDILWITCSSCNNCPKSSRLRATHGFKKMILLLTSLFTLQF
ncbi:hypothetical protein ACFE04_010906 [Oxalis oulophora]